MTLRIRSTIFIFEFQMHKIPTSLAGAGSSSTPKGIHGPSVRTLHRTASRLARIHDGVPGQSIPREVMDFYKAVKRGDRSRSAMAKEAVLGIKDDTGLGIEDRTVLAARHSERM